MAPPKYASALSFIDPLWVIHPLDLIDPSGLVQNLIFSNTLHTGYITVIINVGSDDIQNLEFRIVPNNRPDSVVSDTRTFVDFDGCQVGHYGNFSVGDAFNVVGFEFFRLFTYKYIEQSISQTYNNNIIKNRIVYQSL